MKEIHAYRNDDGTYRFEGIGETYDNGKLVNVIIKAARAKISVEALAVPDSAELYTATIKEENDNE